MLSSYMHDSVGRLGPRRGGVATRPPRLSDASLFPGEHILSIGFARAWQALSCGLPLAVVLFRKSRPWSHDWYQGRDQSEPRQGVVEPLNERALGAVLVKLHEDLPKGKFENEAARNVGGVAGREHQHGLLQLPFEIGPHVAHGGWLKRRIRGGKGGRHVDRQGKGARKRWRLVGTGRAVRGAARKGRAARRRRCFVLRWMLGRIGRAGVVEGAESTVCIQGGCAPDPWRRAQAVRHS